MHILIIHQGLPTGYRAYVVEYTFHGFSDGHVELAECRLLMRRQHNAQRYEVAEYVGAPLPRTFVGVLDSAKEENRKRWSAVHNS